ncbi:cannabinoid receptor 1-like [Orbicella faveolata]|uniref:cannabinoid receptor 1-like n=1 Tax=Orbicella faveolata TaxID=48498 RepID=UPI0009E4ADDA|nr:cannabinoid receptor 1-like [Orbicella faveolata]
MSAERYVAIKHPFTYEAVITEVRIILASCLAWAAAIIFSVENLLPTAVVAVSESLLLIFPIYFNVSVYREVSRNKKQIAANQVSLEAKEKLLKKKKAFYTTVVVLLVLLLCYIPSNILLVILVSFKESIPPIIKVTAVYVFSLLPVLNSLFNPLIYAFRIRHFRVAFIQLLSRKTTAQAEELERKIFGTRQIGGNVIVNTGPGNHTLNDNYEPTRRAEPHGG